MAALRTVGAGISRLVTGVGLLLWWSVVLLFTLAARMVLVLGFLLLLTLALVALAAAIFEIDGGHGSVSLAHLATLIHLPDLRHYVGVYLQRLEAPGVVAWVSVGAGVGAVVLGLLLLVAVLVPRRERLIPLTETGIGPMWGRRRAVGQIAAALAEQPRSVTSARARARPRRGRHGGTVRVRATREARRERRQTEQEIHARLASLSEPFDLTTSVDARRVDKGRRVQ
ncbi:MAG: hypothetical protein ACTHQQ_09020 [Solirubrobacteraceae bacterium]